MISIVTIDGPSAVGKGTLAIKIAKHFDFKILDSGAIYRALAFHVLKNNVDINEIENEHCVIDSFTDNFSIRIFLDGVDVSKEIRSEKIGLFTSKISKNSRVRKFLLEKQRNFINGSKGLVADGRDMGSIVFPEASFKFFLTAHPSVRAERRYQELKKKKIKTSYVDVLNSLSERDSYDSNRKISRLKPAEDAEIIDTTNLSEEKVFNRVLKKILIK